MSFTAMIIIVIIVVIIVVTFVITDQDLTAILAANKSTLRGFSHSAGTAICACSSL
jgi:Mg2+/Co2+ transporter CorB